MTAHCTALQQQFLARLATSPHPAWKLIEPDPARRGRFLAFRTPKAPAIDEGLKARRVIVDHRGDILRIGFGLYQVESDLDRLVGALASLET